MAHWLVRRLVLTIVTFVGVSVLVFVLMRLAPVDPIDVLLYNVQVRANTTPEAEERLRADLRRQLGLDQAIPIQYVIWVKEIVTERSLGYSFSTGRASIEMVAERLPPTLLLMGTALVISIVVGIPLGILAALRRNRLTDYLVSGLGMSAAAVPSFFLALAAVFVFSARLKVLPASGMFTPPEPTDVLDSVRHLILPATVLGLAGVGPILRYVRTSLLETLSKDYLMTARAKGLSERSVIVRHAFPNGLLPVITVIGLYVGGLLSGAFVVENVFGWPGLGTLGLKAIQDRDYPVLQAFAVTAAVMVLLGNLLADLAYGLADPRIRLD